MLCGALTTISGCTTTEARQTERVVAAATAQGQAAVKATVPDQPAECRKHMGRVYPKVGDKVRSAQLRWEFSADLIDAQIDRCAKFHDDWKEQAQ